MQEISSKTTEKTTGNFRARLREPSFLQSLILNLAPLNLRRCFFCKFSVGIRRRNDCSKMCLRFARHPFRHTFTQRCGLFSCLTSCFLRIVYFNWCIWGIWICTLNPWHEPGTKMFDVFCEYSCLVQTRFFSKTTPKRVKRPKMHFLRQGASVPDTWHDAMAELSAKLLANEIMWGKLSNPMFPKITNRFHRDSINHMPN